MTVDNTAQMRELDPGELSNCKVLITVPHMDDAVLACGGTILKLANKNQIHLVYCTDGKGILNNPKKAASMVSGEERIGDVRQEETRNALRTLGVPLENVHFLTFPEHGVPGARQKLRPMLKALIESIQPDIVLTPFRYDRHPDHIALSRMVESIAADKTSHFRMLQYFVYYHWRLLPAGDMRRYVRPEFLLRSDLASVSAKKREALDCFVSQTTCFYPWQHKPVLSDALLAEFAEGPEYFLDAEPGFTNRTVLTISALRILTTHRIERSIKVLKEYTLSLLHGLRPNQS